MSESPVEEDLMFHLKIAEASKNAVLKSLLLIITPDIINNSIQATSFDEEIGLKTINEHKKILQQIINRNSKAASLEMRKHLEDAIN